MSKNRYYIVPILIALVIMMSVTACDMGTNIVRAVDENYQLQDNDGTIKKYKSSRNVSDTVNDVVRLKRPYDKKVDKDGKSILLYDDAVIVIEDEEGKTEIELIKDHGKAYNRHRNTMIMYWGGSVYRNGRINTPRSIRRGSFGSSSTRGGGFSFGK